MSDEFLARWNWAPLEPPQPPPLGPDGRVVYRGCTVEYRPMTFEADFSPHEETMVAIVTKVHADWSLDLRLVIDDEGFPIIHQSRFGAGPGHWTWFGMGPMTG